MGEEDMEDSGADISLTPEQLKRIHDKLDLNKDGTASLSEVLEFSKDIRKQAAKKDVGAFFQEMDMDKDGKLSFEELIKDMEEQAEGNAEEMKDMHARKVVEQQK